MPCQPELLKSIYSFLPSFTPQIKASGECVLVGCLVRHAATTVVTSASKPNTSIPCAEVDGLG